LEFKKQRPLLPTTCDGGLRFELSQMVLNYP